MKKNIYTGIFCTILGLCINTPANASIISRSFLDEALTDYATTTALDLKANQSDFRELNTQISDSVDLLRQLLIQGGNSYKFVNNINPEKFPNTISGAFGLLYQYLDMFAGSILYGWTDENGTSYAGFDALNNGWTDSEKKTYLGVKGLNDKIGTLPEGITVQGMYEGWTDENRLLANPGLKGIYEGWVGNNGLHTQGLQMLELDSFYTYNPENDSPQLLKGQKGGLLNVLSSLLNNYGYSAFDGELAPFWKLTQSAYKTDELSAKIGTLPSGDMQPSKGLAFLVPSPAYTYPTTIGDSIFQLYSGTLGLSGLAQAVYHGNEFMGQTDTALQVKGLRQITDEIGTLPSGSLLKQTPFTNELYKFTQGTDSPVYPNSMAELVKQIYGESLGSGIQPGLVHLLITGFPHNGGLPVNSDEIGILPAMSLAETANSAANTAKETANAAKSTAQANAVKIGTVPDGKNLAGMISETDAKIGSWDAGNIAHGTSNPLFTAWAKFLPQFTDLYQELYLSRPISLADLISKLYGRSFDEDFGILGNIGALLEVFKAKIGTVPDGKNLAGMISETDAKIGDLPTEYATVGAALSAIKGIAEEAKAAALAAIPDPKTEGSNGKYVLTVDIIGDNATYRWEPIDRSKTTATTE